MQMKGREARVDRMSARFLAFHFEERITLGPSNYTDKFK